MSRTKTYRMMMENKSESSVGSNAIDEILFFGDGITTELFDQLTEKSFGIEDVTSIAGSDPIGWIARIDSITNFVHNVNNMDTSVMKIDDTCSLDDLIDAEPILLPSGNSENFIEASVGSPLSSGDEANYDLEDFLKAASPEDVLSSKAESASVLFAEHMYATPLAVDMNFLVAGLSPVSNDSSLSSSGESSFDEADDFLQQFFNDAFDDAAVVPAIEVQEPTVDFSVINSDVSSISSGQEQVSSIKEAFQSNDRIRFTPYQKKKKTPEQKLRKKAQNRNAASKYRSKKKMEMEEILSEADTLEAKNKELKDKASGLRKEIDYLKNLMLDVIKVRLANGKQNSGLDSTLSNTLLNII